MVIRHRKKEGVLSTASPRGHVLWSGAVCHLGQRGVPAHCPVWDLGGCCISYFSWQVLDSAASLLGSEVHGSQGGEVRGPHRRVSAGVWARALVVQWLLRLERNVSE